jgi:hypothetical protein
MYRKFVNARSPLRMLEKGLHGGLGIGNVGALVAGRGVGKSSFLVGVALDELLRGGTVLHVTLDHSVGYVRDYYDTVYEALASHSHLDDATATHAEVDSHRRIRAYQAKDFNSTKLADAVKIESEAGARPTLIVVDGLDPERLERDDLAGIRALAQELAAEVWFAVMTDTEHIEGLPAAMKEVEDVISVILAMEPKGDEVSLRALKDHENEDLHDLHVGLDPKTLLLIRS